MRKYQTTIAMMQIMISKLQLTLVGFPPYEVTNSTLGSKKIEIIKKIPLSGTSSFSFPLAFTQAPLTTKDKQKCFCLTCLHLLELTHLLKSKLMQEKTGPIKEWVTPMENKLQDTTDQQFCFHTNIHVHVCVVEQSLDCVNRREEPRLKYNTKLR